MKPFSFLQWLLIILISLNAGAVRADWEATVWRVIDGDTIVVKGVNGVTTTVRLIGVDTPETKSPHLKRRNGKKVPHYFGKEATEFVERVLKKGQVVTLTDDPRGPRRDKYKRRLAYVKTTINSNAYDYSLQRAFGCDRHKKCPAIIDLNLELNRLGFSKCVKRFKHSRRAEFLAACALAKKKRMGQYQSVH